MFSLNGKVFTANSLEVGATGFYKIYRKNSIRLYNTAGEYIAAINSAAVLCNASHVLEDGRIYYSHATVKEIGLWDSYLQKVTELENALKVCGLKKK